MLNYTQTVVDVALTLALYKGVLEPIAAYWGSRLAIKYVPKLLDIMDPLVPAALTAGKIKFRELIEQQLDIIANQRGEYLTKSQKEWIIREYEKSYSPLVNADKLANM